MNRTFTDQAWEDFIFWASENRKIVKKINQLLDDIERNGHDGLGKSEPLTDNYSGWWSKRIDQKNRLIYKIDQENNSIIVFQCKGHYND